MLRYYNKTCFVKWLWKIFCCYILVLDNSVWWCFTLCFQGINTCSNRENQAWSMQALLVAILQCQMHGQCLHIVIKLISSWKLPPPKSIVIFQILFFLINRHFLICLGIRKVSNRNFLERQCTIVHTSSSYIAN